MNELMLSYLGIEKTVQKCLSPIKRTTPVQWCKVGGNDFLVFGIYIMIIIVIHVFIYIHNINNHNI